VATFRILFSFLTLRERTLVLLSVGLRLLLVSLDLAGIFLVGAVASVVAGSSNAPTSEAAKWLVWLEQAGFRNGYAILLGVAVGFFIVKGLVSFVLTLLTTAFVGRLESAKAKQVMQGIFNSDLQSLRGIKDQDVLYGLTNSLNAAFAQTIIVGGAIVGELGLLVAVSVFLAIENLLLFLAVAIFFGAIGLFMQQTIGRFSGVLARRQQQAFLTSQASIMDGLANFRQIAGSSRKGHFVGQFSEARALMARSSAFTSTLATLPRYITEIAVMLGVGFLLLQRTSASSGSLTAATIAIFLAGIFRIVAAMLPLQSGLSSLSRIFHESELGFELAKRFLRPTHDDKGPQNYGEPDLPGFIEFQNVSFGYERKSSYAIRDAAFSIHKGAYVALTGSSGSGKSTIADLMMGLLEPTSGQILIGGTAPKQYIASHIDSVGYVPQVTKIIQGSFWENITLTPGADSFDSARINEALHLANLDELVASLPRGLQTPLGSGEVGLSGGQAQRIGLARALYLRPSLLILDEATSALDDESEAWVSEALAQLKGHVTCIVIAHRPATIKSADQVFRVRAGKVTVVRNKSSR
jgi:ABC-type multidrug transport system fused ATPase/permease subunit